MKTRGKRGKRGNEAETGANGEIDALFQLPLGEFTKARNSLATRLAEEGHSAQAAKVKALVKPSISVWAVNQLYWKHKPAFEDLLSAGQDLIQAQVSQFEGKASDVPGAQAEQRDAISKLSRLAEVLLQKAGHKATPDTMLRIRSTLEALSSYPPASDRPHPGRLTADVNPPGFESLSALIPAAGPAQRPVHSARIIPFKRPTKPATSAPQPRGGTRVKSGRALRAAEQQLRKARKAADDLAAAQKKAAAQLDEAEKKRIVAEQLYERARSAEQEARKRLEGVTAEAEKAANDLNDAAQVVESARESLKQSDK